MTNINISLLGFAILAIALWGEPNLIDATIHFLMEDDNACK